MITNAKKAALISNSTLDTYKKALKAGHIAIDDVSKKGQTALFFSGLEKAKYLIAQGININHVDNAGYTALVTYIVEKTNRYFSRERKEMINLFFENGLDIPLYMKNVKKIKKEQQEYTYMPEVEEMLDLISGLSEKNLKIAYEKYPLLFKEHKNKKLYEEISPLFYADEEGKAFLLSLGFDVNAENSNDENASFFIKSVEELDVLIKNGLKINDKQAGQFNDTFFYSLSKRLLKNAKLADKDKAKEEIIKIINYTKENLPEVNLLEFAGYSASGDNAVVLNILLKQNYLEYASKNFPQRYDENFKTALLTMLNTKSFKGLLKYAPSGCFDRIDEHMLFILKNSPSNFLDILPFVKILPEKKEALNILSDFCKAYNNNECKLKIKVEEFKQIFKYIKLDIKFFENDVKSYERKDLLNTILFSVIKNGDLFETLGNKMNIDLGGFFSEYVSSDFLLKNTTPQNIDVFYKYCVDYFKNPEMIKSLQGKKEFGFILKYIVEKEKNLIKDSLEKNNSIDKKYHKRL